MCTNSSRMRLMVTRVVEVIVFVLLGCFDDYCMG